MCVNPNLGDKVVPVRCQPKTYPCPTCGRRGHRKRRLDRYVRSLDYGRALWLHVFYAEYTARCNCRKYFRSWVPNCCPKADYDNLVRRAVLNRILDDGLNVERTIAAMKRDFLLALSTGFVYDCLNWGLAQLSPLGQRQMALKHFSGFVCVDELHLGEYTLLLATDPIADRVIGYRLVKINDQAHLRCFLRTLQYWGFEPQVVVTDGSNLYPAVLQDVWPTARHQLCVFHVLQDVTNKVLDAVRRLRRGQARRGKAGRKRRHGRPSAKQQRRARRRRTLLLKKASYREVPELVKAMGLLEGDQFDKMVAFLECPGPAGQRVRTNNHVERANRQVRYDEKVRYKFRTERSLDRFLRLRLGRLDQPASARQPLLKAEPGRASTPQEVPNPCRDSRAGAGSSV